MTSLTDIFGGVSAHWMNDPRRPCGLGDPDEWFQPAADRDAKPQQRLPKGWAKELCKGCPVLEKCLTAALENDEQFGVWGGLTAQERAELKRKGRAA